MVRMDAAEGAGPPGPRDGWTLKDAAFQFVNVNDSLKVDKGTRSLIRSRATWSSYHSADSVALDKPDRKKQMGRFRLQPPRAKTSQSQAQKSVQRHSGLTEAHTSLGGISELQREPPDESQTMLDELTNGELRLNALDRKKGPIDFRRGLQQNPELFLSISSGLRFANLANALADPFDVLPLPVNFREDLLLKHCKTVFYSILLYLYQNILCPTPRSSFPGQVQCFIIY